MSQASITSMDSSSAHDPTVMSPHQASGAGQGGGGEGCHKRVVDEVPPPTLMTPDFDEDEQWFEGMVSHGPIMKLCGCRVDRVVKRGGDRVMYIHVDRKSARVARHVDSVLRAAVLAHAPKFFDPKVAHDDQLTDMLQGSLVLMNDDDDKSDEDDRGDDPALGAYENDTTVAVRIVLPLDTMSEAAVHPDSIALRTPLDVTAQVVAIRYTSHHIYPLMEIHHANVAWPPSAVAAETRGRCRLGTASRKGAVACYLTNVGGDDDDRIHGCNDQDVIDAQTADEQVTEKMHATLKTLRASMRRYRSRSKQLLAEVTKAVDSVCRATDAAISTTASRAAGGDKQHGARAATTACVTVDRVTELVDTWCHLLENATAEQWHLLHRPIKPPIAPTASD